MSDRMQDERLTAFKVADVQQVGMGQPPPQSHQIRMEYPGIEALIEHEKPKSKVEELYNTTCELAEKIVKDSTIEDERHKARQILTAINNTQELIMKLTAIKSNMIK
jgi:hypothetical protein